MTYLTTALEMFLSNPAGYLVATVYTLCMGAGGYVLLWFFAHLMGFGHKGLYIKSEWELAGRAVVSFDPAHPAYRPADRIRVNGVEVYSRFSPGARVEYQAAWEHFKHVYPAAYETDFREGWESNASYGNPIFSRDYAGHPTSLYDVYP